MPTLLESASNAIRRFMCASTIDGQGLVDWIDQSASSIGGGNLSGTPAGRFGLGAGMAFRGLVCPAPTGGQSGGGGASVTYPPPGNEPGQCDLEFYNLESQYTRSDGVTINQPSNGLLGPIEGIGQAVQGNGNIRVFILCRGFDINNPLPPGSQFNIATNLTPPVTNLQIISYALADGSPDDCGAPLPQQPPTGTDMIDYDDPDGNPTVDNPITFNPTFPVVLPTGAIIVPITVNVGGLTFVANFNMGDLTIEFDFSEGAPGGESCCPPTELPPEDENPPESPDPPDSVLRYWGVLVRATVSSTAKVTEVGDGDGKTTYLPDLGWVRFAIQIGGWRGWTEKVEIQTIPQLVAVNAPAVAYDFDVHARPGVTIDSFPVIVQGTDT